MEQSKGAEGKMRFVNLSIDKSHSSLANFTVRNAILDPRDDDDDLGGRKSASSNLESFVGDKNDEIDMENEDKYIAELNKRHWISRSFLKSNICYMHPNHVTFKMEKDHIDLIKTRAIIAFHSLLIFLMIFLMVKITQVATIDATKYVIVKLIFMVFQCIFKIIQAKEIMTHSRVIYTGSNKARMISFILVLGLYTVFLLPYDCLLNLNCRNSESSYSTGSQISAFQSKMGFITCFILIQATTTFRFWITNESYLTYRKTIKDYNIPKLVKVANEFLLFSPIKEKIGDDELREHYKQHRQFSKKFDYMLISEVFILILVYTLQTLDYSQVGTIGPIDSAMLISEFISNVMVFYISLKHRAVNSIIRTEHKIIFVQNSLIDSIGQDEMKTVVGTVVTIMVAIFLKR